MLAINGYGFTLDPLLSINYSYSKPESTSSSHRTYTSVTVAQLKDDLNDNALNAANTWKNKYVKVTGILSNIDSDGEYF